MQNYRFRPGLALTAAALVIAGGCIKLGLWQLDRAAQKQRLAQDLSERMQAQPLNLESAPTDPDVRYRRAVARGRFDKTFQLLLDNCIRNGRPGYEVVTPLHITGTDHYVLVNRGWLPTGYDRSVRPEVEVPEGEVEVTGYLDKPVAPPFVLGQEAKAGWDWRWLFMDMQRFKHLTNIDPGIYLLLQNDETAADPSLLKAWTLPDYSRHRHIGYAVQWLIFALIAVVIYFRLAFRPVIEDHADPFKRFG